MEKFLNSIYKSRKILVGVLIFLLVISIETLFNNRQKEVEIKPALITEITYENLKELNFLAKNPAIKIKNYFPKGTVRVTGEISSIEKFYTNNLNIVLFFKIRVKIFNTEDNNYELISIIMRNRDFIESLRIGETITFIGKFKTERRDSFHIK